MTAAQTQDEQESIILDAIDRFLERDVKPYVMELEHNDTYPEEIVETIFKLASTTFVQAITSSALAVIAPLLVRGFNEREIRVKRRTCVVSENLLKLVKNPRDVATFLPVLMPLLSRCEKEVRSLRKNTH